MATYYIDPVSGSAGNDGLTPFTPKAAPPAAANGIVWKFKRGTTYTASSQWNWGTSTGCTLEDYGDPRAARPIITISTALTNGINVQGDGTHTFRNIQFVNCSNNVNGGVVGLGLVAASGFGADAVFYSCRWYGTAGHGVFTGETGATASRDIRFFDCEFENIGHDTFFGGAQTYFEWSNCTATKLSTKTSGGDGLGWFGVDPTYAWVHDSYFDHRDVNVKHCIIFDTATTSAGTAVIENNIMLCFGDENNGAGATDGPGGVPGNVGINGDAKIIAKGNYIETAGIGISFLGDSSEAYGNIIVVKNGEAGRPVIGMSADACIVHNNTLVATQRMPADHVGIALGSVPTGTVKNNILKNMTVAIRTPGGGSSTLTASHNWFDACNTNYLDNTTGQAWTSGGGDITDDARLDARHIPLNPRAYSGADNMGGTDRFGNSFPSSPSFGAVQRVGIFPRGVMTDYDSVGDKESFIRGRGRRR